MSQAHEARAMPESVQASLRYLAGRQKVAAYIASVGGGEVTPHEGEYVTQAVTIRNARAAPGRFSLDREGFMLISHETAVGDFYDDAQITDVYEDEVKAIVKAHTGARRVEIFDHTLRSDSDGLRKERMIREPAATIHNDYTAESGPRRLRDHFPDSPEEADELLRGRFAIVNLWRSIDGTVLRSPMAFCDATSVAPEDLIPVERRAKDRIGEIQMAVYSPDHRWFYFPGLAMDEALLIKTYDSSPDVPGRFTPHTAFEDPLTPEDAPPRESIETRCFVFY